jgi:D-sedoheptulose 7-phosphate isomerase
MIIDQFELILEGPADDSTAIRGKILEVLSTRSGFRIIDVDEALSLGKPVSIYRSEKLDELRSIRDLLCNAGGKVEIVRYATTPAIQQEVKNGTQVRHDESTFEGFYRHYAAKLYEILERVDVSSVEDLVQDLQKARKENRQIFVIGNGGSAATASHFATDFGKHRFKDDSYNFRIMSLTDNTSWISAIGNDDGYENIFVTQLKNLLQRGDYVIGISSSGNSKNVINAIEFANNKGCMTWSIVGFTGGPMKAKSKKSVHIPTKVGQYGFHEDVSLVLNHMLSIYIYERDKAQLANVD